MLQALLRLVELARAEDGLVQEVDLGLHLYQGSVLVKLLLLAHSLQAVFV